MVFTFSGRVTRYSEASGAVHRNEAIPHPIINKEFSASPRIMGQSLNRQDNVSEHYANIRQYNQSDNSYDHDNQYRHFGGMHAQKQNYHYPYYDDIETSTMIKGVGKYFDPANRNAGGTQRRYIEVEASGKSNHYAESEASGISNHYAEGEVSRISKHDAESVASGISKHYAESEASGISKHYAESEASGISKHYAESEASGISKHYAASESTGISIKDGGISNFYKDMDFESGKKNFFFV